MGLFFDDTDKTKIKRPVLPTTPTPRPVWKITTDSTPRETHYKKPSIPDKPAKLFVPTAKDDAPRPYLATGMPLLPGVRGTARFTNDYRCRDLLWREWSDVPVYRGNEMHRYADPFACFIGMNPSCADEWNDDKTIRMDIEFTRQLGLKRMCKVNLFSLCATKPEDLLVPENEKLVFENWGNDLTVILNAMQAHYAIACWGRLEGRLLEHAKRMSQRLLSGGLGFKFYCFGVNQDGSPKHTSRLAHDTPLVPWKGYP